MKRISLIFSILVLLLPFTPIRCENTKALENISNGFVEVGKKAIPAVVFIKAEFTPAQSSMNNHPLDQFHDELFRQFFGNPPQGFGKPQPQIGAGSGCIVSDDGYILTNYHVVQDANKITVVLNNGDEYEGKLVGTDSKTDLAVLKIPAKKLSYLSFGNSEKLQIGEWAIAIGSPFALQATLTVGVVSAKGRQDLKITDIEDFIQTDAAINLGNSGGPLLNLKGEIIGINTALMSQSGGYMGIGFAIPSKIASNVMEQIIKNGSVKRGSLGVYMQEIDKELAEALNLKKPEGLLITDVVKKLIRRKSRLKTGRHYHQMQQQSY